MSNHDKPSLKEKFLELDPTKRNLIIGGSVLFILVLALFLIPSSNNKPRIPRSASETPPIKANLLIPKPQDKTVEQLAGSITALEKAHEKNLRDIEKFSGDLQKMNKSIDELIQSIGKNKTSDNIEVDLIEEVRSFQLKLEEIEAQVEMMNRYGGALTPSTTHQFGNQKQEENQTKEEVAPEIVVVGGIDKEQAKAPAKTEDPAAYIVANSMVEGVLLTGMDAPTDPSTKSNPLPAVLRLKTEAVLPNLVSVADIQECFLSVAGWGDMADERAKFRLETLSCVLQPEDMDQPPRVVEAKVEGYLTSNVDGKLGVRGRLVSKQGQLIAKTLLAGTLAGLADGLRPTRVQGLDINPGNRVQTQTIDPSVIAAGGLAQGVSDSARSISEFYLKLADQMMPVLEIDALTPVTVTFLKGVELK